MKKVFLSLAALAFVATGAVSCSSDDGGNGGEDPGQNDDNPGGDDDTPGGDDDTPGTEGNVFNWDGTDYAVDTTVFGWVGTADGPTPLNVDTDGDGAGDTVMTQWVIGAFNGPAGGYGDATDLVETSIFVPVEGEGEDAQVVLPQESEEIYLANTVVVVGDQVVAPGEADEITGFSMMINFVDDEDENRENWTIDYETATEFTSGAVSVAFNGALDAYYYFSPEEGQSVSSVSANSRVGARLELGGKASTTNLKLNLDEIVDLK